MKNSVNRKSLSVLVNGATSGCQLVTNKVPKGSTLWPVISLFINDQDAGFEFAISKFADDAKLRGTFCPLEGQEDLQED